MKNILDEIVEVKIEEVKKLRKDFTISRFSHSKYFHEDCLDFHSTLSNSNSISLIAEVKKASPSKGVIREDFNHKEIAETYIKSGADSISILTDENFFQGSTEYLTDIAEFKTIPLLRKDFIIDEYQVYQAKSIGADAILLICEILSQSQISELTSAAEEQGMSVLLEMHSAEQISKINFEMNRIIGVNNRDLTKFETDLKSTKEISSLLPSNIVLVSESGITSKSDMEYIRSQNVNAILVGEHFMRSNDIAESVSQMKEYCNYEN